MLFLFSRSSLIKMRRFMILIFALNAIRLSFSQTQCGVCSITKLARCLNQNTVEECDDNYEPTGSIYTCPEGKLCFANSLSTGDAVCQYPSTSFPSAHDCESQCIGVCPVDNTNQVQINYICTGPYTYRFCSEYYDQELICPVGTTCTVDAPCASNATNVSLCPYRVYPKPDPDSICAGKGDKTRHPLVPPDPFCEKYVYCRIQSGTMKGTLYTCPKKKQFHPVNLRCEKAPVPGCRTI